MAFRATRIGYWSFVLVVLSLLAPRTWAYNCTVDINNFYCSAYDDNNEYLYDKIMPATIAATSTSPELAGHHIIIDSAATFYHNTHGDFAIASMYINGTGHFFVDSRSSVAITGDLIVDTGATLTVGHDSTVHVEGILTVRPGAMLIGVINTRKDLLTFVHGAPAFTHFIVKPDTITFSPEIFFDRMLCETPAFVVEDGRNFTVTATHRIFICESDEDRADSVIIYDGALLSAQSPQPSPIIVVPVPVPTPMLVPPPPQASNKNDGIDIEPRRVWPYIMLIILCGIGVGVYVVVARTCGKRIRRKWENVKVLMENDDPAHEYEFTVMDPSSTEYTFMHDDASSQTKPSVLTEMLRDSESVIYPDRNGHMMSESSSAADAVSSSSDTSRSESY